MYDFIRTLQRQDEKKNIIKKRCSTSELNLADVTLTSLTQYARRPGATQSSLLQSARPTVPEEKRNVESEEKKPLPAPKKKRKKKHGITANLSGTRYEVSKYSLR